MCRAAWLLLKPASKECGSLISSARRLSAAACAPVIGSRSITQLTTVDEGHRRFGAQLLLNLRLYCLFLLHRVSVPQPILVVSNGIEVITKKGND
jgi:hypothetical protein